jgi:DNA-directed RNA polymerase specialized sigma24 family protein
LDAELNDRDLHIQMLARDPVAFTVWQTRVGPDIIRMLVHMGLNFEDAEDAWNRAFLGTIKRLANGPPIEPMGEGLRRYAFGAARRQAYTRLNELEQDVPTISYDAYPLLRLPDRPAATPPSPGAQRLAECIQAAPDQVRSVAQLLLASAVPQEIAELCDIPPAQVYMAIKRTKEWLARCVSQKGGTS